MQYAPGKTAVKAPSPFAQMSGAQLSNMIAGYTSKLPQPLSEGALQGRAQGMLDPVIKSITDRLDASGRAGAGAITGYANSLASSLEPYQQSAHNIYANAESSQAASDAALSSALKGQGNTLAASLADKLAGFGAGDAATAATAAPAAAVGAGAGNALLANGSASLADLISQGASAESYASKLPGIARTQGQADLRDLTLSNGKQRTDAIAQLEQQLPSLVQNLRSENDSRANTIGSTKLDLYKFLSDQNVTKAGIAANSIKAENAALPTFDASNSRALGYASDQYGNPVGGNVKPLPGYKTDPGGNVVKDKPAPKPTATKYQSKTVNGHVVTFDPSTGTYYQPGTTTKIDPSTLTKPPKPVAASQLKSARQYIQQANKGFYASAVDPTKPLTTSEVASAAKAAGMPVADFLNDAKAKQAAGIGWNQVAPNEDQHIQDIYVTLVKQYGIPPRQAFQMVAGTYKDWAKARQSSYFPKGG